MAGTTEQQIRNAPWHTFSCPSSEFPEINRQVNDLIVYFSEPYWSECDSRAVREIKIGCKAIADTKYDTQISDQSQIFVPRNPLLFRFNKVIIVVPDLTPQLITSSANTRILALLLPQQRHSHCFIAVLQSSKTFHFSVFL
jgi:hypothetical protein